MNVYSLDLPLIFFRSRVSRQIHDERSRSHGSAAEKMARENNMNSEQAGTTGSGSDTLPTTSLIIANASNGSVSVAKKISHSMKIL